MELRDYIDQAAKKAGSVSALARMLEMNQPDVSNAKAHKRGLPDEALSKLSDYLNVEYRTLTAANKLVTEKSEDKKAYWRPFVQHAKAASIALAFSLVTNFVTPSPAEAAPLRYDVSLDFVLCKLTYSIKAT